MDGRKSKLNKSRLLMSTTYSCGKPCTLQACAYRCQCVMDVCGVPVCGHALSRCSCLELSTKLREVSRSLVLLSVISWIVYSSLQIGIPDVWWRPGISNNGLSLGS